MSKIGKINISIPEKVKVLLSGSDINIEGPFGKQSVKINLDVFNGLCSYAIERYTGVVFKNIDWQTFDENSKNYLNKNFYIFLRIFRPISST